MEATVIDRVNDKGASLNMLQLLITMCVWRGPVLVAALLALLVILPFIIAVLLAPSLFVTDAPMAVLQPWMQAMDVLRDPAIAASALQEGTLPYLLLVNLAGLFVETPGQALLVAQGLFAMLLIVPVIHVTTSRLPSLIAILASLLIIGSVLVPAGGVLQAPLAFSVAVFLWLCLACYVKPDVKNFTTSQAEGVMAGIGVWYLYITCTPLFFLSLPGLAIAIVRQGRCGIIFTAMALGMLLILGASAEVLVYAAFHGSQSSFIPLFELRLSQLAGAEGATALTVTHAFVFLVFVVSALATGRYMFLLIGSVLVAVGSVVFSYLGADPVLLILLASFMALSSVSLTVQQERRRSAGFLSGQLALLLMPFAIAVGLVTSKAASLQTHFQADAPMEVDFGFSFKDEPVIATLILQRKLDPVLVRDGLSLTPADQAMLMADGLKIAGQLHHTERPTALVAPGNILHLTDAELVPAKQAEMIITPKLPIDQLTDEARVRHQGILYADYVRASPAEQLSSVWELWVKK
jgi:hypothetical protein